MSKVDALAELYSSQERQINACMFVSQMADDLSKPHRDLFFTQNEKARGQQVLGLVYRFKDIRAETSNILLAFPHGRWRLPRLQ